MSFGYRLGGLCVAIFIGSLAWSGLAQEVSVVAAPVPVDLSTYAKTTDVQAAITAATPAPCATPAADTLNGTAGVGLPCMSRPDATRPTAVQAGNVVTASDGTWAITFARPFSSALPYVHAEVVTPGAALPYDCNVTTRSATGATGKCFQSTTTTLPGTLLALSGLVVSPFSNTTSGLSVMVIAREPTQ